jgi:hypothetical protein
MPTVSCDCDYISTCRAFFPDRTLIGLTSFYCVGNGLSQFEGCVAHRAPSSRAFLSRVTALIKGIRACKVSPVPIPSNRHLSPLTHRPSPMSVRSSNKNRPPSGLHFARKTRMRATTISRSSSTYTCWVPQPTLARSSA